jgi:hypothetical protein
METRGQHLKRKHYYFMNLTNSRRNSSRVFNRGYLGNGIRYEEIKSVEKCSA